MSVIMLNYKRFANMMLILPTYARYERIEELIVWTTNCEKEFDATAIMVRCCACTLRSQAHQDWRHVPRNHSPACELQAPSCVVECRPPRPLIIVALLSQRNCTECQQKITIVNDNCAGWKVMMCSRGLPFSELLALLRMLPALMLDGRGAGVEDGPAISRWAVCKEFRSARPRRRSDHCECLGEEGLASFPHTCECPHIALLEI